MIYLDYNATTPILPEVLDAMLPYLREEWGNPSSSYRFGAKLKAVLENARGQVAQLIGARPTEIVFTSGGTESNNSAIHAALRAHPAKRHIVTSAVEHSSVLVYCQALEKDGYRVTYLPVDRDGLLSLTGLEAAITDDTAVVSLMWANNETGVLFPVKDIAGICRAKGVLYHCDAVQAARESQPLARLRTSANGTSAKIPNCGCDRSRARDSFGDIRPQRNRVRARGSASRSGFSVRACSASRHCAGVISCPGRGGNCAGWRPFRHHEQ
jgi:hypothetical protein